MFKSQSSKFLSVVRMWISAKYAGICRLCYHWPNPRAMRGLMIFRFHRLKPNMLTLRGNRCCMVKREYFVASWFCIWRGRNNWKLIFSIGQIHQFFIILALSTSILEWHSENIAMQMARLAIFAGFFESWKIFGAIFFIITITLYQQCLLICGFVLQILRIDILRSTNTLISWPCNATELQFDCFNASTVIYLFWRIVWFEDNIFVYIFGISTKTIVILCGIRRRVR